VDLFANVLYGDKGNVSPPSHQPLGGETLNSLKFFKSQNTSGFFENYNSIVRPLGKIAINIGIEKRCLNFFYFPLVFHDMLYVVTLFLY
jgi:hypothetical protein